MKSNNIIALLLIIIIIFIVTDYCRNKNNVESFEEGGEDIDYETSINESVDALKKARVNLKETIEAPEQKYKNNVEYLKKIKTELNIVLEKETESRKEQATDEDEKIKNIKHKLKLLQKKRMSYGSSKKFNSVRSLQNGTKLSIDKIDGKPHYLVKLNNEKNKLDGDNDIQNCLSVKSTGNYNIEECNENDPLQYFNLQNIPNRVTYKHNLEKGILSNDKMKNDINYPFNLIKSNHNKNCLQNFNNQISITPCEPKKSGRWEPLEEHIYCSRDENKDAK